MSSRDQTSEELTKEEEEVILAMTDDIEICDMVQKQPAPMQDYNTKQNNYNNKKLGLRGNCNRFNLPSGTGLLPTPTPSFNRSPLLLLSRPVSPLILGPRAYLHTLPSLLLIS